MNKYSVSQKFTNLVLNYFNKLEPISVILAHIICRIFATNHNYIFLLNLL